MRKAYLVDDLCRECNTPSMFAYKNDSFRRKADDPPILACLECRKVWLYLDESYYLARWNIDVVWPDRDPEASISYHLRIAEDALTDPAFSGTLPG